MTIEQPITLYLLRHGEYVDLGSETVEQDKLNRLSDEGEAQLRREAATLAAWKLPIDTILSSPFVRARQTADIIGEALCLPVYGHYALTRTEFDLEALSHILSAYPKSRHMLLVGHEPDFSRVAGEIIGRASLEIERGGLIRIALESLSPLTVDI